MPPIQVDTCRYFRLYQKFDGAHEYACIMGHKSRNKQKCPASCSKARYESRQVQKSILREYPVKRKVHTDK